MTVHTGTTVLASSKLGGSASFAWLLGAVALVLFTLTTFFGGAGAPLEGLAAMAMALVALTGVILLPTPWPSPWLRLLAWAAILLLGYAAISLLPATWLGLLIHPSVHPYYSLLGSLGLTAQWPALSAQALAAAPALPLLAGYTLLLGVLIRACSHEGFARRCLQLVAVAGGMFAVYGLAQWLGGNQHILWLPKTDYPDSLSSTFISRNHAATFLGLGMLASLALALLRIGEVSSQLPALQRLKALWLLVLRPGAWWWGVLLVQWMALVLTSSRAGLGVSMVGILVFMLGLAWARAAVRGWLLVGLGGLVLVGLLVLSVLGMGVNQRAMQLDRDAAQAGGRAGINLLSHRAIAASPALGHGYGAWEAATRVVRSPEVLPRDVSQMGNAHSLYLQTWVELGWPGLMGLLVMGGLGLAILLQGLATRRRQVVFPALGLAAFAMVGLHSAVDFPLHIPAVMLAFMLLLATGLGQAFRGVETPLPYRWWPRLGSIAAGLALGLASSYLVWAQWPSWQAAPTLQVLEAGKTPPLVALQAARTQLNTCLQRAPWMVKCGADLTLLHLTRAGQVGVTSVAGQVMLRAAELQGKKTLALAPANPILAYRVARVLALQGKTADAQLYLTHSLLVGPYEPRLATARAWLVLRELRAGTLSPEDRALYASNLAGLWQQDPRRLWQALAKEPEAGPILAEILAAQPGFEPAQWQRITRTPWPLATPLAPPATSPLGIGAAAP